ERALARGLVVDEVEVRDAVPPEPAHQRRRLFDEVRRFDALAKDARAEVAVLAPHVALGERSTQLAVVVEQADAVAFAARERLDDRPALGSEAELRDDGVESRDAFVRVAHDEDTLAAVAELGLDDGGVAEVARARHEVVGRLGLEALGYVDAGR